MQAVLAQPRGFCAGVTRAIHIVERALELHGTPVYVFHEIVHNPWVVDDLRSKGAVFVDDLALVPGGSVLVFSAHGVSNAVVAQAEGLALHTIDATCPLVSKVHQQAQRFVRLGHTLLMIGHAGHEEVVGTVGRVDAPVHLVGTVADVARLEFPSSTPLAYVTQTTLSLDDTREIIAALTARFPRIVGPDVDGICYATHNRQIAVRRLAAQVDLVLVVGARNSSNSNRLREVAERSGVPAHLVQDEHELQAAWLDGAPRVGVTSGASTPELLVQRVVCALQSHTGAEPLQIVHLAGAREDVTFRLPAELGGARSPALAHG
ncbi:4-hydroxy-3-methylbut-2-enyl diphosphate reductase [Hydrogenophaga sp. RAC07]|uniref:4-hydroxy-3-methylbut-2-enyl diphosphate reductase n=1 Tax=Hydrogenophaga sp. RAC07 TaxID=1842537 RepID=UPI00083E0AE8|nr:4-hydroxy-3-methylbut-2-enyl diphosphate reductase [Hydrogenophaga sp. RAC07]AOF84205.1 4-hydroxy-3-methylbut-2-enyl diphosphate reductase [Hydrogenophaga sp. RAC07]